MEAKVSSYTIAKDFFRITDSMLVDSGTTLARFNAEKNGLKYEVSFSVTGDVRVRNTESGDVYKCASQFPDELYGQVMDGKVDTGKYEICESNWVEFYSHCLDDDSKSYCFAMETQPSGFRDEKDLVRFVSSCI